MKIGKALLTYPFLMVSLFALGFSQTLPQSDNFSYASASELSFQGFWTNSGLPAGNPVTVAAFGLQYTGYPGSGVGLSALLGTGREGIALYFSTTVVSASLYYSMMIKVDSSSQNGSHVVSAANTGGSYLESGGLLYVQDAGSGWKFGIKKVATGGDLPVYTTASYSKSDTQVVVVKYTVIGGTLNDAVSLWVNPDLSGAEPSADVTITDPGIGDANGFHYLFFTNQANSDSTYLYIDGVRVATSWSDSPLPVQLTNFAATSSLFGVDLRWSTATELNNYGFDIERRRVGDETSSWKNVGFVQGAGTSTSPRDYSYTDSKVDPGRYAYRIKQIDMNAAFTYYSTAEVEVGLGPKELALEPNYPNPFNPSTNITFTVPLDGRAALKVYNMLGQEVATLFDEEAVAGRVYQKTFDASSLPTGVYVSRLEFGGQSVMRKMLFVK